MKDTNFEDTMRLAGKSAARISNKEEVDQIIDGLLSTIRSLRAADPVTPDAEKTIFALRAAIEGLREGSGQSAEATS